MSFPSWTHWRTQARAFPGEPIVVRRRVLTVVAAAFMALWAVWIFTTLPVPIAEDGLTRDTWWIVLGMGLILGGVYLYSSSQLVIRRDEVEAKNPLWTVRVRNDALVGVQPGWHLRLLTSDRSYAALAVEARNVELIRNDIPGQEDLTQFLVDHIVRGSAAKGSSVRIRFRFPGLVFWVGLAPSVYGALVIATRN